MGIGAHALDELNGRPLRTSIPSRVLVAPGDRLGRGGSGARHRRRVRGDALDPAARRDRRRARARLQPRAAQRPGPHRPRFRARLGRLPAGDGVRRADRRVQGRDGASPPRGRRFSRSHSAGFRTRRAGFDAGRPRSTAGSSSKTGPSSRSRGRRCSRRPRPLSACSRPRPSSSQRVSSRSASEYPAPMAAWILAGCLAGALALAALLWLALRHARASSTATDALVAQARDRRS